MPLLSVFSCGDFDSPEPLGPSTDRNSSIYNVVDFRRHDCLRSNGCFVLAYCSSLSFQPTELVELKLGAGRLGAVVDAGGDVGAQDVEVEVLVLLVVVADAAFVAKSAAGSRYVVDHCWPNSHSTM